MWPKRLTDCAVSIYPYYLGLLQSNKPEPFHDLTRG